MEDKLIIRDGDVDTAVVAEFESNRRDAIRRGLIAGGGVLAASSIPFLLKMQNAFAQGGDDADIVIGAVDLEQAAVLAYDTAASSGLLDADQTKVAELFRDQEQEHADALITALEDLGGTPPPAPKKPEDSEALAGLADVKDAADIAAFAIELENSAIIAYSDAHGLLQSPDLLATGAQIMANEGQHLVVLRQVLGASPADSVPSAFEAGDDPPPKG